MGIAESMKGLTEDILASYDVRVKALGDIVADTHKIVADARKTMKGFTSDRKKMSTEQAEALGNYVKDLTKNVSSLLKEFGKNRKAMSEKQAKILEELTKSLTEFAKSLTKNVNSMLNGFKKQHKDMSEELKEKLTKEIKDIQVELAFQYNDSYSESVFSFVNNINTIEGGTHVVGLKSALTRVLNDYGVKKGYIRSGYNEYVKDSTHKTGPHIHLNFTPKYFNEGELFRS